MADRTEAGATRPPPRSQDLDALFAPASVAVYGASRDERKLGHRLLANVLASDFGGDVVAVNPSGDRVLGVDTVPTLRTSVDLALISVPALHAPAAVADAAAAGCGAAIVLSSGFGETGAQGRATEAELALVADAAGMALVGPNCMGVLTRTASGGWLNATYFWDVSLAAGPVSFVSQSGAFGGMFLSEAGTRGLGVARFLSLGNSAAVTETDVLRYLADDPDTGVVGIFAEGIRDGRAFVSVAREVTSSKPVVVLKAGKESAGAAAVASHTGSMAGNHEAARAAFARAGVIETVDSDAFFDALAAVAARVGPTGRRVAVLTISGGPSVLAADAAGRLGLTLPEPSEDTRQRLAELAPSFAALGNPIDLTPQCPPEAFEPAVDAVCSDPAFDGVVVINCGLDVIEFGAAVAHARRSTGTPVTAFVLDAPGVERRLRDADVPCFASPERAVRAFATVADAPAPSYVATASGAAELRT